MLDDIDSFNYTWLLGLVKRMQWGDEVTNLLLVGMHDVVTPTHYDTLENLYVQVGTKGYSKAYTAVSCQGGLVKASDYQYSETCIKWTPLGPSLVSA